MDGGDTGTFVMADTDNRFWPKTPDGTIDWEVVFEHPDTGFIPIIMKAPTPAALRDCTLVVITMLHSRDDDPGEVARFKSELERLVPDSTPASALPVIGEAVTGILRRIKEERQQQAAAHLAEHAGKGDAPRAAGPGIEAKGKSVKERRGAAVKKPAPRRIGLVLGAAAAATAAAAGIAAYLLLQGPGDETDETPNMVLIHQMEAAARGEGPPRHIFGGMLRRGVQAGRAAVTANDLPAEACFNAAWYLVNRGSIIVGNMMPKRVSPPILKELCSRDSGGTTLIWLPKKGKTGG